MKLYDPTKYHFKENTMAWQDKNGDLWVDDDTILLDGGSGCKIKD